MLQVTSLYGLRVVAFGGLGRLVLTHLEDGQVFSVSLPDGVHDMTNYQPLMAAFDAEFDSCIVNNVAIGERRIVDQRAEGFGETAAVPTYTPSEAVVFERMVANVARRVAAEEAARQEQRVADAQAFAAVRPVPDDAARLLDVQPERDPVDPVLVTEKDVEAATPEAQANEPEPKGKPKPKKEGADREAV